MYRIKKVQNKKTPRSVSLTVCPTLRESVRFRCPCFCIHLAVCLSFCLSSSLFFLTLLCCDRSHKRFSLCIPVCPCLCTSLFVSLFLWCHSISTLLLWLCADLPLPLWVSVHLSVFLSPFPSLDVFRMWQKSLEPLYLRISCLSLPCWCFFHQSGAGSEKAVHLSIAGDEHHVPVNTRPLVMLSHLVSSSLPLCYSLLIFFK